MPRKVLYLAASLAALTAAAAAETPETIVVTATRTPQPLADTGTSLSVISGEDLQTQQITMLTDALAEVPGLTIVRNGGAGQNADVLMRGAEAGQTLVLVDGVRLNDPSSTTGFALLGDVLVNGIDRVEVLRGPQSTLYGSDAIGGVINIMTTRGGDTPFALRAEAEGGSYQTYHVNAAANGTAGDVEYGAAANYLGTNSVSAADSRNGNPEADGYHHLGFTGNVRWNASQAVSVDARLYYTKARDSFDGYPPPNYTFADTHEFGRNTLLAAYGGVNVSLFGDRLKNRFAVTRTDADRKTFDPTMTPSEEFFAKGGATRLEYQGVFDVSAADQVTFGAETEATTLTTQYLLYDPAPTHGSDRINGYYLQWETKPVETLTLTGGVRYDEDRAFGGHTSVKFTAAWQLFAATTLRANYGDGFKAPSLYELYSQYSNPLETLRPEKARGWEAGIDQGLLDGKIRASLTYFERRTNDQIDFFTCYVTSPACSLRALQGGYYYNVNRSRVTGVEFTASAQITDTLSASLNYTNLSDKDLARALQLARRPHDTINAAITWRPDADTTLGLSVDFLGKRYDDAGHFTALREATHANLFASYRVFDGIEIFGRVENLLNDGAEPVAGYGTPGRAVYAGVRTSL